MAIEIEKKFRLAADAAEALRSRLHEVGAVFQGRSVEENVIYGGGTLDEQGSILRIRRTGDATTFTYKRRIDNASSAKRQIEYELKVDDAESLEALLSELRFEKRIVYEKRRETWSLDDTEIMIDQLPFGWFVEIEGELEKIQTAEKRLGLDTSDVVDETYPRLTVQTGRSADGVFEARFTDANASKRA